MIAAPPMVGVLLWPRRRRGLGRAHGDPGRLCQRVNVVVAADGGSSTTVGSRLLEASGGARRIDVVTPLGLEPKFSA